MQKVGYEACIYNIYLFVIISFGDAQVVARRTADINLIGLRVILLV